MSITIGKTPLKVPQRSLCILLDAADPKSYPGADYTGTTWYDLSGLGNDFKINGSAFNNTGPKYMDFNGSYGLAKYYKSGADIGIAGREQGSATMIVWTRIKNATAEWRTLTRPAIGGGDHHVIVQSGGWNIGMYDGLNGSGFNSTGYSQQSLPNYATNGWNMLIFRFNPGSPQFTLSANNQPSTILGSVSSNNASFKGSINSLGGYGNGNANANPSDGAQYWGDIGFFACWNRVLSDAECLQVYNATSPRFAGTTQQYQGQVQFQDSTSQVTAQTQTKGDLIGISTWASAGSYVWTKPADCTSVLVKVTGGGGGAAGYCESGGAGGYAEKYMDASGLSTVTVTVGGGGSSTGYYAGGGNGGTSSFGSYVSASGGYGANQNYSHSGGAGGVGSGGQINLTGGDGTGHANSHGHYPGGTGGGSWWGGSSTVRRDTTSSKLYSGAPGTGGPGGRTDDGGGGGNGTSNGENGIVVVYAYR